MTPIYLADCYFWTILSTYVGPRLLLCPIELSQILIIMMETLESPQIDSLSMPLPDSRPARFCVCPSTEQHLWWDVIDILPWLCPFPFGFPSQPIVRQ